MTTPFMPTVNLSPDALVSIPGGEVVTWGECLRRLHATFPPPVEGWRPIETAPKDGTPVLLWTERGATFGSWRVDEGFASKEPMWLDDSFDDFSCGFASTPLDPTHWAPVPKAPV